MSEVRKCQVCGDTTFKVPHPHGLNLPWIWAHHGDQAPDGDDCVQALVGARLIELERDRQKFSEGWTPEHDDDHTDGSLWGAAVHYIQAAGQFMGGVGTMLGGTQYYPRGWPWHWRWWKPLPAIGEIITIDHIIRMLVKAGALICAEIDRLLRLKASCNHPCRNGRPDGSMVCTICGDVEAKGDG